MNVFTPELLTSLGIKLPANEQAELVAHLTEALEERIGLAIFDLLDDDEAEALIELQDQADDEVLADWIKANVPDYEQIIEDEFNMLLAEVSDNAKLISA